MFLSLSHSLSLPMTGKAAALCFMSIYHPLGICSLLLFHPVVFSLSIKSMMEAALSPFDISNLPANTQTLTRLHCHTGKKRAPVCVASVAPRMESVGWKRISDFPLLFHSRRNAEGEGERIVSSHPRQHHYPAHRGPRFPSFSETSYFRRSPGCSSRILPRLPFRRPG